MQSSPLKKIETVNLRYDRNVIINPNPDKKPAEEEILHYKVPELLQKLLSFALEDKTIKPDSNDAIHASYLLRQYSENPSLRKALAFCPDFIEVLCIVLNIADVLVSLYSASESTNMSVTQTVLFGAHSSALKRCQQHALAILNNLLLEDPLIDSYVANDENCLPGLSKMLTSSNQEIQDLAAKTLDYLSVTPENQTLICYAEDILYSIIRLLHSTKSDEAKKHVLQALIYLSANPKNVYVFCSISPICVYNSPCFAVTK